MADGSVLMAQLEKRRGPAAVLSSRGELDSRRNFEVPEALGFVLAGEMWLKREIRGGRTRGRVSASVATELLACDRVDVAVTNASRLPAVVANRFTFVTALMADPVWRKRGSQQKDDYRIRDNVDVSLASTTACLVSRDACTSLLEFLYGVVHHGPSAGQEDSAGAGCVADHFYYAMANQKDSGCSDGELFSGRRRVSSTRIGMRQFKLRSDKPDFACGFARPQCRANGLYETSEPPPIYLANKAGAS